MLKRWQRMARRAPILTSEYLKAVVDESRAEYSELKAAPSDWDMELVHSDLIFACVNMLTLHHIESPETVDDCGEAQDIAAATCDGAIQYLFGDWRVSTKGKSSWKQSRNKFDWLDEYRVGLAASILINSSTLSGKIAEWPDHDLAFCEEKLDLNDDWDDKYIPYHVALADMLRGEDWQNPFPQPVGPETRTLERAVLLATVVDAINKGSHEEFSEAIAIQLECFLSTEFFKKRFDTLICWEASIVCGLARQCGLPHPQLPIDLDDLIITPQTAFPPTS